MAATRARDVISISICTRCKLVTHNPVAQFEKIRHLLDVASSSHVFSRARGDAAGAKAARQAYKAAADEIVVILVALDNDGVMREIASFLRVAYGGDDRVQ